MWTGALREYAPPPTIRCVGVPPTIRPRFSCIGAAFAMGAGAPEAVFVIERLMDMAADAIGLSSAEIRRRNLVPASAIPYKTAIGTTLDSGDFEQAMDRAESMAELPGYPARKVASEAKGRLRGIGYGNLLEACGAGIADRAVVSCLPDGRVRVRIGTMSNGQSHETVYAQMLADCLDIDINCIDIIQGDSNETPWGMGTGASRSMTVCGSALVLAAARTSALPQTVIERDAPVPIPHGVSLLSP